MYTDRGKKACNPHQGSVLEMNCKLLISSRDTGYKDCISCFKVAFSVVNCWLLERSLALELHFLKMAVR